MGWVYINKIFLFGSDKKDNERLRIVNVQKTDLNLDLM